MDPSLLISETGIGKQKARVRQEVLQNHKKSNKRGICFKFDAKTNYEALLHCQKEQAHHVTVIEEPSNKIIDFFKVETETGKELADGVWNDVVFRMKTRLWG